MRTLRKFGTRISAKLLISFATVLVLVLGLSFSSLTVIGRLGASLDKAVNEDARKARLIGDINAGFQQMRADSTKVEMSLVNMLIDKLGTATEGGDVSACSSCHTKENVKSQKLLFDKTGARLKQSIAELRPLATASGERAALDVVESKVTEWLQLYEQYLSRAWERDFNEAHEIMLGKLYPLTESLEKVAAQLVTFQQDSLRMASTEARARVAGSRTVVFVLLALCLAAGGGVYWIVRGVNFALRKFATELETVTDQVTAAASQVSSSSHAVAQGASDQVASLQETASSSEEINSMAQQNAESARIAAAKMDEAAKKVNEANQSLQQMVASMDAISASSGKISRIIKVIDEIAFQTNILALNAAVEAARAGDAGLGFAVVADEVRNLAQRSAQAARETAGLIEESIAMSQDGKGKFDHVTRAIRATTESASQVKALVDSINVSSQQQTRGVANVAKVITQVERVTQANAASAQQNASAGEELNAQSASLKNIVESLAALV